MIFFDSGLKITMSYSKSNSFKIWNGRFDWYDLLKKLSFYIHFNPPYDKTTLKKGELADKEGKWYK